MDKKKIIKILAIIILVPFSIFVLGLGAVTIYALAIIAKYSSELPDPDAIILKIENKRIQEKDLICKIAQEKRYSKNIEEYDPIFYEHKGIDYGNFFNSLGKCGTEDGFIPKFLTIESMLVANELSFDKISEKCRETVIKNAILSTRLPQKYEKEKLKDLFIDYVDRCKENEIVD